MSGKPKPELNYFLGDIKKLGMAAEHGFYYAWSGGSGAHTSRPRVSGGDGGGVGGGVGGGGGGEGGGGAGKGAAGKGGGVGVRGGGPKWEVINEHIDESWVKVAKGIMDVYTRRTSGTYTEKKGIAVLWHYRHADTEYASLQAKVSPFFLQKVVL